MTTGLPARVAICAVLLTAQLAGPVRADALVPQPVAQPQPKPLPKLQLTMTAPERRQVAVIDLSEDDQVRALSGALYASINASDTMSIPNRRGLDNYLTGSLSDEDSDGIEAAKTAVATAQTDLDEADSAGAANAAKNGQEYLAKVTPSPEVQALYAELSFLAGLAALDQGRAQDANLALALTHRLDPARQLPDAQYPPNTIAAYKRAIESKPQLVKIEVAVAPDATRPAAAVPTIAGPIAAGPTTVGPLAHDERRVWIDFVDRGPIGSFDGVEVGDHVITIVGSTIDTAGTPKRVTGPTTVPLKLVDATPEHLVKRARLALSRAQAKHDDAARVAAMKQLAEVVGVGDAVMISKRADGKLQWETWRDRGPGFSAPQVYTDQKPDDILEGLGPLHRPPPPRFVGPPLNKLPIEIDKPWYQERWIQASVGAGVVAAIVSGILIATRTQHIQFPNGDIKDVSTPSSSR